MMAMRPPTSPTTVMGGFSLGINTEEGRTMVRVETSHNKRPLVGPLAALTGDLHAGVDGSGGLDGGRGVSAVHLVRLGVLSLAVDHRDAQTQALGERLGSGSAEVKHTRSRGRNRMWDFLAK